jgi:hypothetical protein
MKGVKLAASVPRGISAESGRRLFQALVPLASTPLEVCLAKNHKLPAWAAPKEEREHLTYKGFANTQTSAVMHIKRVVGFLYIFSSEMSLLQV